MLAKHGPWSYHIRAKSIAVSEEIEKWLAEQGKKDTVDYEVLIQPIDHKHSRVDGSYQSANGISVRYAVQPIIFFNDLSTATYVKMTWGGR